MTVGAALRWGIRALGASATAALDARVLMKAAAALDDAGLIINERAQLSPEIEGRFAAFIARRATEEPVAHIIGVREFWSLPIAVRPGILVPRPDSETLVEAVLERRDAKGHWRVLDLGSGSGALLCALLKSMQVATGVGIDICEDAAKLTACNLVRLGLAPRGHAICGEWTAPLAGRFDIVISNPPYISDGERGNLSREVEAFEDARALFAGPDGLEAYRALARAIPTVAAGGALIALELGEGQAEPVRRLFRAALPAARFDLRPDLAGVPRVLIIDLA